MSADARDGFKVEGVHVGGCRGLADDDGITFVAPHGMEYDRDRIGRRNGSTGWHRFLCNDTRCEVVLLVRWDRMAAFVNGRDDFNPYEDRA